MLLSVFTTPFKHNTQSRSHYLTALVLSVLLTACTELPYTNLDNNQLETFLNNSDIPVYDIRRADEWIQTGVIEGSELLTFVDSRGKVKADFIERFTSSVGKNDPVILICRTGNRTSTLARYLVEKMGYTQVYNVRNGISDWIREKRVVKYL